MSKAWYDDNERLESFYHEVAEHMVAKRFLRAMPESAIDNDAVRELVSEFIGSVAPLKNFPDFDNCIEAVLGWMGGNAAVPLRQGQRCEAAISRTFGDTTMSFSFGAYFDIQSPGQMRAAFAHCIEQVEKQFDAHVSSAMIRSRSTVTPAGDKPGETFEGDEIVVETRDGKQYYKITGGPFVKFGVRVWPEVLEAAGIPTEKLEGGKRYNLGRVCTYSLKENGKPEKVIYIPNA